MSDKTSDLYLSPNQTDLLVAALTSNKPAATRSTMPSGNAGAKTADTPAGASAPSMPGSGRLDLSDESPFLDYPLDGEGDESYNYDEDGQMFGDLPDDDGTDNLADAYEHLHDKRKSIDGGDEDDTGGGKRREGEDKTAKKPGRKPLTSEPTTKRKAQNRAAQRAFRERKEKHLKDLETKVEDLEKASEATNHENAMLRAQVERMNVELKEYRKRLSWVSSNGGIRSQTTSNQSRSNTTGPGSSDFQFQFPKFGDSPSTTIFSTSTTQRNSQPPARAVQRTSSTPTAQAISPASSSTTRHSMSEVMRPRNSNRDSNNNSPMNQLAASPPSYTTQPLPNAMDNLSGLFSPSLLEATKNSPNGYFGLENNTNKIVSRGSFDNSFSSVPGLYSGSSVSNTESPGSSSDSQQQLSSIGTSPEPNFNSPNNKIQDFGGLNTISEEHNFMNGQSWDFDPNLMPQFDPTGFNFLAQQQGGNFDPVLFGDYRETQDNLVSQDFGSFFNEAYPLPDLGSPSHNYGNVLGQQNDQSKKTDLLARVDAAKESDVSKPAEPSKLMTCNKIWDRLQSMEKFRNGEIDIDNLCSELRAKAKCSEGGAVVEEKHVNKLLGFGA